MINGNETISEKYDELSEYLLTNIKQEGIDRVTVRSLIGACTEFDQTGVSKSSMVFPSLLQPGEAASVKFSNIKFNLKIAFDIILLSPSKPFLSNADVFLFVIKILKFAFTELKIDLDKDMVTILKAIYMQSYDNHGADIEQIIDQAAKSGVDEQITREIIGRLESIKCIILDNGEYKLAETILLNFKN